MSQLPIVLVVDDEKANLDTFQRVFRKDLRMTLASSGAEALEVLEREPIQTIVIDYAMPEMDGLELARRVEARWPAVRRIMLTAHSDLSEVRRARSNGLVSTVLIKPWSRDEVLRWITVGGGLSALRETVGTLRASVAAEDPGSAVSTSLTSSGDRWRRG